MCVLVSRLRGNDEKLPQSMKIGILFWTQFLGTSWKPAQSCTLRGLNWRFLSHPTEPDQFRFRLNDGMSRQVGRVRWVCSFSGVSDKVIEHAEWVAGVDERGTSDEPPVATIHWGSRFTGGSQARPQPPGCPSGYRKGARSATKLHSSDSDQPFVDFLRGDRADGYREPGCFRESGVGQRRELWQGHAGSIGTVLRV
jgi:hypothetical protein